MGRKHCVFKGFVNALRFGIAKFLYRIYKNEKNEKAYFTGGKIFYIIQITTKDSLFSRFITMRHDADIGKVSFRFFNQILLTQLDMSIAERSHIG